MLAGSCVVLCVVHTLYNNMEASLILCALSYAGNTVTLYSGTSDTITTLKSGQPPYNGQLFPPCL